MHVQLCLQSRHLTVKRYKDDLVGIPTKYKTTDFVTYRQTDRQRSLAFCC